MISKPTNEVVQFLLPKITPYTAIITGGYHANLPPLESVRFLFENASQLYSSARAMIPPDGFMLLMETMVRSGDGTFPDFCLEDVDSRILALLELNDIKREELKLVSRHRLLKDGLRRMESDRSRTYDIGGCELAFAEYIRQIESDGFQHAICLYDHVSTTGGLNAVVGVQKSREQFGTKIGVDLVIARDRSDVMYNHFSPVNNH